MLNKCIVIYINMDIDRQIDRQIDIYMIMINNNNNISPTPMLILLELGT